MILHVSDVKYLGDFRLHLVFNNGESGEVDLSRCLEGEIFEPLKSPELFATVRLHPVFKTVTWSNGADLAPEYLLDLMRSQRKLAA
jgi:hypothetical protein